MRAVYLANGNNQFKFADTTTEIRLNAFDDGSPATLTADAKVRIKNDSGYLLGVSASITNNQAVITSGQLAQLPPGNYLIELWDTVNGGTAIYPSEGFLALQINDNATGLSGKLVSSITVNDFIRQFSSLSQQVKEEAVDAKLSDDQLQSVKGALRAEHYVYSADTLTNYSDANTLPNNSIVGYTYGQDQLTNVPANNVGMIITFSARQRQDSDNTQVQLAITIDEKLFIRRRWDTWKTWHKIAVDADFQSTNISSEDSLVSPYNNLNDLPEHSFVTYTKANLEVANSPYGAIAGWLNVFTSSNYNGVITQLYTDYANAIYIRTLNSTNGNRIANPWQKLNSDSEVQEAKSRIKVLEDKVPSLEVGGSFASFSIFQKFAVVGDSYASALLGLNGQWTTFQDGGEAHRWGQMIATRYGLTYTHLGESGLSTRTWLTRDSGLKAMQSADPQDLYMLCLGINDYSGLGIDYLGSESDMESGADTFYGNYAKIIKAIQTKAPKGKIVMYGVADNSSVANSFSDAQQKIAAHFGIPFISEREDPLFVSDFYKSNMEGGHPRVPVYGAMSKAMVRLTEKVIDRNEKYFHDIGWN